MYKRLGYSARIEGRGYLGGVGNQYWEVQTYINKLCMYRREYGNVGMDMGMDTDIE